MLWRSLAAVLIPAVLLSCGPTARPKAQLPEAIRGLPPHEDPPIDLADDDELERARNEWEALRPDDPRRAAGRAELWEAYRARTERGLAADDRERAFRTYETALEMWRPDELADSAKPAPGLDLAIKLSEDLAKRFAATGNAYETVLALVVLRAAQPDRGPELDKRIQEIMEYVDDLAVAEQGTAAHHKRPIAILEAALMHLPSDWLGDELIARYIDRQKAINDAVVATKDTDNETVAVQTAGDFGARFPGWAVIRAQARLGRIEDALAIADGFSGQFGDIRELRDVLRAALSEKAEAQSWTELIVGVLANEQSGLVDYVAALRACELAARRFPAAADPRTLASRISAALRNVPLAIRWAEEAHTLAPRDADTNELLARLYVARLGGLVFAERTDAARVRLAELEKFHADNVPRTRTPPSKDKPTDAAPADPLGQALSDAYLTMGRGLFNIGEIEEAKTFFRKAHQTRPSPEAIEQLATIAFKKGQFVEATRLYREAAAMDRDTPLAKRLEEARLLRHIGESLDRAGDRAEAKKTWRRALTLWAGIVVDLADDMTAEMALAHTEMARLEWHVGEQDRAVHSFEKAVDADPEQVTLYADVVAFLVTRGKDDAAIDAWHRGVHRPEVTEYFKVYSTLWVHFLSRVSGGEPDPFAVDFLAARDGGRWFQQLARFYAGKITYEELLARADTRGKRAEAFFYEAMNRFARKDDAGARELLRNVVATDMLGFFEYDMATYFLEHGPPR